MGLRNIVIRREQVALGDGQSFDVRGISLFDIMKVVGDFGPQMAMVYGKIMSRRAEGQRFDNATIREMIRDVAGEFPDLLAATIALASDDYSPESMAIAKQLPMLAQIEAVEKVFSLTFASEGDVKKLIESLIRMLEAATGTLELTTLLPGGIGGSVAN